MRTLPDGSLTVAALHPERSWTQERQSAADIVDSVYAASVRARIENTEWAEVTDG